MLGLAPKSVKLDHDTSSTRPEELKSSPLMLTSNVWLPACFADNVHIKIVDDINALSTASPRYPTRTKIGTAGEKFTPINVTADDLSGRAMNLGLRAVKDGTRSYANHTLSSE
jgi:hypothetical protein